MVKKNNEKYHWRITEKYSHISDLYKTSKCFQIESLISILWTAFQHYVVSLLLTRSCNTGQVSFLLHGNPSILNIHPMTYQQTGKEFPPTNSIAGKRQEFKWQVSHKQMWNDENIFFCSSLKTNYIGQLKKKKYWNSLNYIRKENNRRKNELDRARSSDIYCRAIKKIYQLFVMLQDTKHKRQNPASTFTGKKIELKKVSTTAKHIRMNLKGTWPPYLGGLLWKSS